MWWLEGGQPHWAMRQKPCTEDGREISLKERECLVFTEPPCEPSGFHLCERNKVLCCLSQCQLQMSLILTNTPFTCS